MAGAGVSASREDIALRLRRVSRVWGAALYVGSVLLIVLIAVLGLGALGQYSYQAQVLLFGNYRGQLAEIDEKYQVLKTSSIKPIISYRHCVTCTRFRVPTSTKSRKSALKLP